MLIVMHLNKIITITLLLGFITPLFTLVFISYCDEGNITDCLLRIEPLMPDFYWHYNIIKYVAAHGLLPEQVITHKDGGYDGISADGEMKPAFHGPTYYYLAAGIFILSKNLGFNSLLSLHLLSLVLMLTANFILYLLFKKISKHVKYKKQFIIFSVSLSVFLPLHLYIGVSIHNQSLFYLFMVLSFYLYANFLEEKCLKRAISLGIALGLSLLTSIGGLLLIAILAGHYFYDLLISKTKKNSLLLISLIAGIIIGAYAPIRNYLLFNDVIWGGINNFGERSFLVILRAVRSYFGGIYGGYDLFSPLIWFISILIIIVGIYGVIKSKLWNKEYSFIWGVGLLTLLFGINTVCNIFYISHFLNNFSCFGANLIHGRYFLAAGPMLILFFSLGFINLFRGRTIMKYILLWFICFVYLWEFIYALIKF